MKQVYAYRRTVPGLGTTVKVSGNAEMDEVVEFIDDAGKVTALGSVTALAYGSYSVQILAAGDVQHEYLA
jgi:hypothetical protein